MRGKAGYYEIRGLLIADKAFKAIEREVDVRLMKMVLRFWGAAEIDIHPKNDLVDYDSIMGTDIMSEN